MKLCPHPSCKLPVGHLNGLSTGKLYDLLRLWHKSCGIVWSKYFLDGRSAYNYIKLILNLPLSSRANINDVTCLACHNILGLAEWSYWLPAFNHTYTHCQAHLIVEKILENPFGCSGENLRCGNYGSEGQESLQKFVFEMPLWRKPSIVTVLSEYAIARSLKCPYCGGELSWVRQELLTEKNQVLGDVLIYRCKSCNKLVKIIFIFRKPKPGIDRIEELALLALVELLDRYSNGSVPDYYNFTPRFKLLVSEVHRLGNYRVFEGFMKLLLEMLEDAITRIKPRARMSSKYFDLLLYNYLKLLNYVLSSQDPPTFSNWRDVIEECIREVGTQYIETWRGPSRRHSSYPVYKRYGEPGLVIIIDHQVLNNKEALRMFINVVEEFSEYYSLKEYKIVLTAENVIRIEDIHVGELNRILTWSKKEGEVTNLVPAIREAMNYADMDKSLIVLTKGYIADEKEAYREAERAAYNFARCALITTDRTPLLLSEWLIGRLK